MKNLEVLIIEDQLVFEVFMNCIEVLPEYFGMDEEDININFAYTHNPAVEALDKKQYNLILLGHGIPRYGGSVKVTDEKGLMTDVNCRDIEKIGYGLIDLIEQNQPNALVIGTSSFDDSELKDFKRPKYHIHKND